MAVIDQPDVMPVDMLRLAVKFHGDKLAVSDGSRTHSWAEFGSRILTLATGMQDAGLKAGDRVCLAMQNSVDMYEAIWATALAGGVITPLNVTSTKETLMAMINSAAPSIVIADSHVSEIIDTGSEGCRFFSCGTEPLRSPWVSLEEWSRHSSHSLRAPDLTLDDSMSIIYSSGTTGVAKGIEHTIRARLMYPFGCGPALAIDRFTVNMIATPLYANGSWITMMPTALLGGTNIIQSGFDLDEFGALVEEHRATHVFLVPTQLVMLLAAGTHQRYDLTSLRVILSAGAPLSQHTYWQTVDAYPHAELHEIYGMTEGFITHMTPGDLRARDGRPSVGKPIYGADIRIVGTDGLEIHDGRTGEIVGRSPGLMKGYFDREDLTAEAVWVSPEGQAYIRSGDLGYLEPDGYLCVSGRLKDMIISGGVNIYSADLESVFIQHPDIMEVAAVGLPHPKWGETPVIFIIPAPGRIVDPDELLQWGNDRLERKHRASALRILNELPRAAQHKVRKAALREEYRGMFQEVGDAGAV